VYRIINNVRYNKPAKWSVIEVMSAEGGKLRRGRSGQIMLEYAIVVAILVGVVSMLALFLFTFKEQGGRVMDLISSDYP